MILVPLMGSFLIRLLHLTNKKEFHAPDSLGEEAFILASWHGEMLMIPYAYTKYRKKPNIKLLISDHFDGSLIAMAFGFFGFGTIRGSSSKNAARALLQSIKELKNCCDLGITPDGPRGPRHEVADGIVIMAQKANVKVLLVEIKPSKFWKLGSWDQFVIPKPFGTIRYYVSDLLDVGSMEFEEARTAIKKGLLKHEN